MSIVSIPKILLPKAKIDKNKWSVVACDQFTSQPDYWQELETLVGDEPSCLNMIFPEVYLQSKSEDYKNVLNANMKKYLDEDIFDEFKGLILVKRTLSGGGFRLGLMLQIDLEHYDYTPQNDALIKATEKTVVERLPIRIKIRENAPLELPHIMLLMDNEKKDIIEELYAEVCGCERLYDFDLNMNGGRLEGYVIKNAEEVLTKIEKLAEEEKYGEGGKILFAVGDGNHSLATAKECWNNLKDSLTDEEKINHPARFALCELVNLHDDTLKFEAIHRVLIGADEDFILKMKDTLKGNACIKVVLRGQEYLVSVSDNPSDAIADIQTFIDEYIQENKSVEIDYIHGDNYLLQVANKLDGVAIFMPVIEKGGLFSYVARRGVLPRKSFSMGHAEDKRYYFEARKILK